MKQTVFGVVCMLVLTFLAVLFMTIHGRTLRQTETDHALGEAIDAAMSNVMETKIYTVETKEELVADFLESLLIQMNSTSEVEVAVLNADEEKGILSIEVTEHYTHPNGSRGNVSEVRTVIFEKEEEKEPVKHQVEFYLSDGVVYKKYELTEGEVCSIPAVPKQNGRKFAGWQFVTGGSGIAGGTTVVCADGNVTKTVLVSGGLPYTVEEDTRLVAVFE